MAAQTQALTVSFYGNPLYIVEHNGEPYTPMKPIVKGMGIDWTGQFVKLRNQKEKFGYRDISIPSAGGIQEMLCMPLRKLNGWLFSINPAKVKESIRPKVIQYQEECFVALHDYWTKGEAINPRHATADEDTPLLAAVADIKRARILVSFFQGKRTVSLVDDDACCVSVTRWPAFLREYDDISRETLVDIIGACAQKLSRLH